MFDAEAWLLLPEKDIIERYHGTLKDEPQDLPSLEVCCLLLAPSALVADDNG
jgi:hypothetical protein